MIAEHKVARIAAAFIAECKNDFVGLWALAWEIRRAFPEYDVTQRREATMRVARLMLVSGNIMIGDFDRDKRFVAWPIQGVSALELLEEVWDTLGREPDIGDLCWFAPADSVRLVSG
jgi:hypothetical protein